MVDKTSKVHIWAPDLFSATGGIQAFCRHFIEALHGEVPPSQTRVLIKNDSLQAILPGNESYPINACGDWSQPWRTPRFAFECLRQAQRERPSLVISMHLHFSPLALAIRESFGIPYVLMAYGIEAWRNNSALRQKSLRKADLVLAISRYTRDWLIEKEGVNPERVQILAPTYTAQQFSISSKPQRLMEKYNLNVENPVILTICRLVEEERYKGYDQIIKAMPQILSEVPNARYLIVGKGPDRPRIEKLIAEVGVQDAVTLVGFVPDEELADYYNLCDLFAMPSKAEGFGIVYLEALACGKPVLAGNKDGSRDALADGELGILVDPDDVGEIAREMIQVITHQHSHPCIYQPELLRKRVIELFGFSTFKHTLTRYLSDWVSIKPNQTSSHCIDR